MRIAQVSTLSTPVTRDHSGSVEQIVWLLTRELGAMGHEVTVFGARGSDVSCELVETMPGPYNQDGALGDWYLCEWINLCRAVEQAGRFDVIHAHGYLWGIPLAPLSKAPLVHTLHICASVDYGKLLSMYPGTHVAAISHFQWQGFEQAVTPTVIHHGIDPAEFTLRTEPDDYVCFLGRMIEQKGPLEAVLAAKALGLRIVLAGHSTPYFEKTVAPLVDGRQVQYLGAVGIAERNRLLGGARAMLYPNRLPEPFGLVMPEAMMCGTPVVAMRIGAVPEVVDEGITGFTALTEVEFRRRITDSFALDRRRIREVAEARFSARRMAEGYERLYRQIANARAEEASERVGGRQP